MDLLTAPQDHGNRNNNIITITLMIRIKPLAAIVAVIVATFCASAAKTIKVEPSDRYVTRVVTCPDFNKLVTNTSIDIEYTIGPKSVKLYAPDNLIDHMQVRSSGKTLTVTWKENENLLISGRWTAKMIVSAPAGSVNEFMTNSSGDIFIKSNLGGGVYYSFITNSSGDIKLGSVDASKADVKLVANSSGDISAANVAGGNVTLSSNSSGDVEVSSVKALKAASLSANSSGDVKVGKVLSSSASALSSSSGDVKVGTLSADDAVISSRSSGDVSVDDLISDMVTISAVSVGDIKVSGKGRTVHITSSSNSEVRAKGLKAMDLTVEASSSGEVDCYAVRSFKGTCSSSMAEITCYSKPGVITKQGSYPDNIKIGR